MTSVATTGGFTSAGLALEEAELHLPEVDVECALRIGEIALAIGRSRGLSIAIEVRIGDWVAFHAALPGTDSSNDSWIARKARVVALTGNSTMYERVKAEESAIDWYRVNNAPEESHAIHGGGLPLKVAGGSHRGTLLISGLPQVDDHLLGVEVIRTYLNEIQSKGSHRE